MKETSLEAFKSYNASCKKETDYSKIIDAISSFKNVKSIKESILKSKINTNELDPTYLEIAQKAGFYNPNKASRRLSELVRLNKITVTGTKICPIGKHRCQTYDLVNA